MRVRLLYTDGHGKFEETMWTKPEIADDEIEVKAVMTGVCRSDIDMMVGKFQTLPLHMQGHEGLGIVTKVGSKVEKNVPDIKEGDYVATRGEPAYADFYNAKQFEFVKVPALEPRYILEPVACGINVISQNKGLIDDKVNPRILILGSGFLAYSAYQYFVCRAQGPRKEIVVCGHSNKEIWGEALSCAFEGTFDIVIDLSPRTDVFELPIYNNEALLIIGAQKTITTDFSNLLWKAGCISFPSPRSRKFPIAMQLAEHLVTTNRIDAGKFWTKGYNRDTEWQEAFVDAATRIPGYSRGYIVWPH